MGNPIQSVRLTYDFVKKARDNNHEICNEEIVKMLNSLGVPDELIKGYPRFPKGYSAEDLFIRIYSLLPWIKNIVPLGQEQFPEHSKEITQVSDYLVTYETGDKDTTSTLLLEVKLVDNNKQTHKIKKYQYDVLKKYAKENHQTLLFALFWRQKGIWTINSIDVFDEKSSEYKITYNEAIKNDLSSIFGDYIYVFSKHFYRLSRFSNNPSIESQYLSSHEKFGRTICEKISCNNNEYKQLDSLCSPVIDCLFDMTEISRTIINSTETEIVEHYCPSSSNIVVTKLSSLMYAYLVKLWCVNKEDLYYKDIDFITNTFNIVDTARRELFGDRYYLLPSKKNAVHDSLITSQFGKVDRIMQAYSFAERKEDTIICSPHEDQSNIMVQIISDKV